MDHFRLALICIVKYSTIFKQGAERMGEPAKKATMEEVWAAIKATEEARLRGEEALRKTQQKAEEARLKGEEALREAQQRTEEAQQRTEEAQQKTEEALQKLTENLNKASGDFTNKWGQFLENLVKGDLVKILKERNIEVVRVQPRLVFRRNKKEAGDFDLVAINGKEIVVVEVKTTLTVKKVKKFINDLKRFKEYFPEYKDKIVYGGVAYLCEPKDKEAQSAASFSQENGLFVIVSPGGESNVTTISNPQEFEPKTF